MEAARPARCTACGVAARRPGAALQVHGHGGRERLQLGPEARDQPAVVASVLARRYRCLACGAVILVVPRGVLRRRHYGAFAVALALVLHADGVASPEVRRVVSPWRFVGDDARRGWRSLHRWARDPPWPVRGLAHETSSADRARRIAQHLAGHAVGYGSLRDLALVGARVADVHHS